MSPAQPVEDPSTSIHPEPEGSFWAFKAQVGTTYGPLSNLAEVWVRSKGMNRTQVELTSQGDMGEFWFLSQAAELPMGTCSLGGVGIGGVPAQPVIRRGEESMVPLWSLDPGLGKPKAQASLDQPEPSSGSAKGFC